MKSLQDRVVHDDSAKHHGPERDLGDVFLIIAHHTGGESAQSSIDYLNSTADKKASYHYIIDRDGTIIRMCPVNLIAYHAGDSCWPNPIHYPPGNGGLSVNPTSIGIAWANRDDGEQITIAQIESGLWLFRYWMDRLMIPPSRVRGHREVSPGRKPDPVALDLDQWRISLSEHH